MLRSESSLGGGLSSLGYLLPTNTTTSGYAAPVSSPAGSGSARRRLPRERCCRALLSDLHHGGRGCKPVVSVRAIAALDRQPAEQFTCGRDESFVPKLLRQAKALCAMELRLHPVPLVVGAHAAIVVDSRADARTARTHSSGGAPLPHPPAQATSGELYGDYRDRHPIGQATAYRRDGEMPAQRRRDSRQHGAAGQSRHLHSLLASRAHIHGSSRASPGAACPLLSLPAGSCTGARATNVPLLKVGSMSRQAACHGYCTRPDIFSRSDRRGSHDSQPLKNSTSMNASRLRGVQVIRGVAVAPADTRAAR